MRKSKSKPRQATSKFVAKMKFEPWGIEVCDKMCSNDEWFEHLVTCRLAVALMTRTKAQLSDCFMKGGDEMCDWIESLGERRALFKKLSELLGACEARLLISGAAALEAAEKAL